VKSINIGLFFAKLFKI